MSTLPAVLTPEHSPRLSEVTSQREKSTLRRHVKYCVRWASVEPICGPTKSFVSSVRVLTLCLRMLDKTSTH